jgi:hypothetical protein
MENADLSRQGGADISPTASWRHAAPRVRGARTATTARELPAARGGASSTGAAAVVGGRAVALPHRALVHTENPYRNNIEAAEDRAGPRVLVHRLRAGGRRRGTRGPSGAAARASDLRPGYRGVPLGRGSSKPPKISGLLIKRVSSSPFLTPVGRALES